MSAIVPTAIVLKGYPRLSETFIAQEIRALERAGLPVTIVSLRKPTEALRHPVHREIKANILYLPEYLWREPLRLWRAWRTVRRRRGYPAARAAWLADVLRDPSANRIRRFGQALVLASEIDPNIGHLHAHFLHTPSSVARYAAAILGLGWSASAHAVDIYTSPDWELAEKAESADWIVTCSEANRRYLRQRAGDPDKIECIYHGLDLKRFSRPPIRPSASPVRILCVSRLVDKKGVEDVLRALARLPQDLDWTFTHVGGGKLSQKIQKISQDIGINTKITFLEKMIQGDVLAQYRAADIFVLASRIAADGDRDGLPNVLLEAQSQGLPCVATRVSAIPELIRDEETGLLVEPGDIEGLAGALERLIRDAGLRRTLGAAGEARVREDFEFSVCFWPLLAKFGLPDRRPDSRPDSRNVEQVA